MAITKRMRTNLLLDPKWMKTQLSLDLIPRTDLSETIGEDPPVISRLVRPAYEVVKSVTKTSSKVREPKIYDKVIDNFIHEKRWREAIDKEL